MKSIIIDGIEYELSVKSKQSKSKGYEILSFKNQQGDIYELTGEGWYKNSAYSLEHTEWRTAEYILEKCPHVFIHSIRRLSDGEVFTVGDEIGWGIAGNYETNLKGFFISNDGNLFIEYRHDDFGSEVDFEKAVRLHKKQKKPLFTTEDGVDIYEGGKYWYVSRAYDAVPCKADKGYKLFESRTFSTQEAAEEYILFNKKTLSLNDLIEALGIRKDYRIFERLKQVAKQNLNKNQ